MFDRLAGLQARYEQLSEQMAQPDVATDHVRLQQLSREQRDLEDVVASYRAYKDVERQIADAQSLLEDGADAEMRALA